MERKDRKLMKYSKEALSDAHAKSYANMKRLQTAKQCACFYCLERFRPEEIVDWSLDVPEDTAICPYCYIDAVLGDNEGYPLTNEFLEAMYTEWFGDIEGEDEGNHEQY